MSWDMSDAEVYARRRAQLFAERGMPLPGRKARKVAVKAVALKPDPFPQLTAAIVAAGLPAPVREHLFAVEDGRIFRFDYAWPDRKIAVEVDGIVHRLIQRWRSDMVKFNVAAAKQWTVFHFKPKDVRDRDGGKGARVMIEHLRYGGEVSAPTIATLWPPGKE